MRRREIAELLAASDLVFLSVDIEGSEVEVTRRILAMGFGPTTWRSKPCAAGPRSWRVFRNTAIGFSGTYGDSTTCTFWRTIDEPAILRLNLLHAHGPGHDGDRLRKPRALTPIGDGTEPGGVAGGRGAPDDRSGSDGRDPVERANSASVRRSSKRKSTVAVRNSAAVLMTASETSLKMLIEGSKMP